jgi:PAS domain S-box-containing protein
MPADDTHAIAFADAEGVIRFWSPGAERLFGYAAADAVGRSLDLIVPEQFREQHWAGFRRALSTGAARNNGGRTNIPVLCHDGRMRPFPGTFYFLTDAHGVGVGAIAIWGDPVGGEDVFGAIIPRPTRG